LRNQKSYPARGVLGFHNRTKIGDPDCLVLRGALQEPIILAIIGRCSTSEWPAQPTHKSRKCKRLVL
jgi:hypothetical protein